MVIESLDLVRLTELMTLTEGSAHVKLCLVDGPVLRSHIDFAASRIQDIAGSAADTCQNAASSACRHGTYTAGILTAHRNSNAPGICPSCTLLVRPIFGENIGGASNQPSANAAGLAAALMDCINARPTVINLSLAVVRPNSAGESDLTAAMDHAISRGIIVVAAAGNQGMVSGSVITRHPWVIPVTACDSRGIPSTYSNAGFSIGTRGICAPGNNIISTGAAGPPFSLSGTSVAAPFVTGTIALLASLFPRATGQD